MESPVDPIQSKGIGEHIDSAHSRASAKFTEDIGSPEVDSAASDVNHAQRLAAQWADGTAEERRLKRKLDWRILPCTWILYLLGNLDRSNIGNAETGGLAREFDLTSEQYSVIVLVFFTSYLIFEVPANMVLMRARPSVFLPGLGVIWGTFAALMGATQTWSQLAGLRFLMGVAEAGFAPGCAFYLSCWYRKYELATRYSFLYTSVPIAGAVSGLLAGLITQYMDGSAGLAGWRWLFILEGVASAIAAVVIFLLMPDFPSNSQRFLSQGDSLLACNRLAADGIALAQGAGDEATPTGRHSR
ncbi:nicotinamide mononucleotide permease [Apiospora phragmitis]|uniref:Nicotinamide mononucleotide permease n=1 Tax=Apiospora phragmitis TaxID=2905665 RepID=A0ABR1VFE1_9PEZI